MGSSASRISVARRRFGGALLPLLLLLFVPAVFANTSVFTNSNTCTNTTNCVNATFYGVTLTGTNGTADTLFVNGNWTFNGGIALGPGDNENLQKTNTNTANDIVDFASPVVSHSNCNASRNFCGGGTWNGTQPGNSAAITTQVNSAISAYDSIHTALAAMTTNATLGASSSGTFDITSGAWTNNIRVYNAAGFTQSGAITFNCGGNTATCANALIVVKFSGSAKTISNHILLGDGLTSDQLLFYSNATGITVNSAGVALNVNASFFVESANVGFGNTTASNPNITFNGRVYVSDGNLTFGNSGGAQDDVGAVPEPQTWALLVGGLGLIVWKVRARK